MHIRREREREREKERERERERVNILTWFNYIRTQKYWCCPDSTHTNRLVKYMQKRINYIHTCTHRSCAVSESNNYIKLSMVAINDGSARCLLKMSQVKSMRAQISRFPKRPKTETKNDYKRRKKYLYILRLFTLPLSSSIIHFSGCIFNRNSNGEY